MRKLFIYYSRTGNGDLVADFLSTYGYERYRVTPKHMLPENLFWSMMIGGFKAGINMKDRLTEWKINPNDYDEIIFGSPIWNGKISSPMNTVLKKLRDYKGKIRFIFYSGSGEGKKATIKISKLYADTRSIILKEPKTHQYEFDRLREFLS